jgi:hypothetical protein
VPHPFVFKAADFDVSTLHESRSPSPETFLRTLRLAFCRVQLPKSYFADLRVRHPPIGIAGENVLQRIFWFEWMNPQKRQQGYASVALRAGRTSKG